MLETERQEYLQLRDNKSPSDNSSIKPQTPTNHRKRIKTEFENEDSTNLDTSKDELNAAFHSSSIEDDIVEPSQCLPHPTDAYKSKKKSPSRTGHRFNEQNKENLNKSNLKDANKKSPTVLVKNYKKTEVNLIKT